MQATGTDGPVAKARGGATPGAKSMEPAGQPYWMAHPIEVAGGSTCAPGAFARGVLDALGLEGLFAVQAAVGQRLGRADCGELCVWAPTGSGKTLAYALAIVEGLRGRAVRRLRALVLVPTRDLVGQVEAVLQQVSGAAGAGLVAGVDYVVATPGRLLDLLAQPGWDPGALQFLVLDEADRLLDQTWQAWAPLLLARLEQQARAPPPALDSLAWRARTTHVRKLLFSATIAESPALLAPLRLERPALLRVADAPGLGAALATPAGLREALAIVRDEEAKLAALVDVLARLAPGQRALVFTASVLTVGRLARLLAAVLPATRALPYHANLPDHVRRAHLAALAAATCAVLVASDAAARGLDLPGLDLVVNYDCPCSTPGYVHRVGRAARAGGRGAALSLVTVAQRRLLLRDILVRGLNRLVLTAASYHDALDAFLRDDVDMGPVSTPRATEDAEGEEEDADEDAEEGEGEDADEDAEEGEGEDADEDDNEDDAKDNNVHAGHADNDRAPHSQRKRVLKLILPDDEVVQRWQKQLAQCLQEQ